jgi:hypothetical protein
VIEALSAANPNVKVLRKFQPNQYSSKSDGRPFGLRQKFAIPINLTTFQFLRHRPLGTTKFRIPTHGQALDCKREIVEALLVCGEMDIVIGRKKIGLPSLASVVSSSILRSRAAVSHSETTTPSSGCCVRASTI